MNIKLGPNDSAIVFLENGEREAHVPKPKNDDDPVADSAIQVLLCLTFLNNEKLVEQLKRKMMPH